MVATSTPPPAYAPRPPASSAPAQALPAAHTRPSGPALPPPSSSAWEDGASLFTARATDSAVPRTPSRTTTAQSTPPRTPTIRTTMPDITPSAQRMAARSNRARTPTTAYARAEPADAVPGTPSSRAQEAGPKLPALTSLMNATSARALNQMGEFSLDVAVTVAGLDDDEAEAFRAALTCPRSKRGLPLSPTQLNDLIEARNRSGRPFTYDQLAAIRAADAAHVYKDGRDDSRSAGHQHRYYLMYIEDRRAVFSLGTKDMASQAILMDRQVDSLTIIASVRPETTAQVLNSARDLNVFFHISRSIVQDDEVKAEYREAVEDLKNLFIDRIAMRHVKDYAPRLARSGQTWAGSTPKPMTEAAADRMVHTVPRNPPRSNAPPAVTARTAVPSPRDGDDIFSPHAPRAPPALQPPPTPSCIACFAEPGEPEEEDRVIDARSRAVLLGRTSIISRFHVRPQLPVELALQVEEEEKRAEILAMLHSAQGDAKLMLALLESLAFCDRHAFKLVAAAADDLAHGFKLLA